MRTVSLAFLPPTRMRMLNRHYRGIDRPANVLSFTFDIPRQKVSRILKSDDAFSGELFLCIPVIRAEAHRYGRTFAEHCRALMIHGFLHIRGYDHVRRTDARRMESLEEKLAREVEKNLGR